MRSVIPLLVGDAYKMMLKDGSVGWTLVLCLGEYHTGGAPWVVEVFVDGEIKIINRLDYCFENITSYT